MFNVIKSPKSNLGIEIFSKGLYSSWCWHKPSRILFDCGEGFSLYMGNYAYGVENIFITHGHADHVNGLASFIGVRNMGRGDREKPLNIFYPKDNYRFKTLIEFIGKIYGKSLRYELNFNVIETGFQFHIDENRYLEAFSMMHQNNVETLGYVIKEKRTRLKAEFVGKNIPELIAGGLDKNLLNEAFDKNTFAYCLDACNFLPRHIMDADIAIMDCTFLSKEDRDDITHFTYEEAVDMCRIANVRRPIMAHISGRYRPMDYSVIKTEYVNPNSVYCI